MNWIIGLGFAVIGCVSLYLWIEHWKIELDFKDDEEEDIL
jgi:hypothetical protein